MVAKELKVFGPETWQLGSRGRLGDFALQEYPLLKNMRRLEDGSVCTSPAWFRWGWHEPSLSYKNIKSVNSKLETIFWPSAYRDNVFTGFDRALNIMDNGGVIAYDISPVTDPPTTIYTITDSSAFGVTQYGFGYLDHLSRYNVLAQGKLVQSQGVGSQSAKSSNGVHALRARFLQVNEQYNYVGSTVHQGRAFYWGIVFETTNNTLVYDNRIFYSDEYDYTNFSKDTQYFTVDGEVRGATSIGPNLLVWTVEGNWFIMQGRGDPGLGILHTKGQDRIAPLDDQAGRFEDIAIFPSRDGDRVCVISRDGDIDSETLARFGRNGVSSTSPRRWPVASHPQQQVVLVPDGGVLGGAFTLCRGAWTEEEWDISTLSSTSFSDRVIVRPQPETNSTWMAVPIEVATDTWEYEVYSRSVLTSRPAAYVDQAGSRPAGTVQGLVETPRIWHPEAYIRILRVTIDIQYWKASGPGIYDALSLKVELLDTDGTLHNTNTGPKADVIANLPNAVKGRTRLTVTPSSPLPFKPWYAVRLDNIQAISIEQVAIEYEISPQRTQ